MTFDPLCLDLLGDRLGTQPINQLGKWNLHRADLPTGPTEATGRGQGANLVKSLSHRLQHTANRSWVDGAIGMSPDLDIDRTVVDTAPATDAAQGIEQFLVTPDMGATIVEQHQMDLLRTVHLSSLTGTGDHIKIGGNRLPGCRFRQQFEQRRYIAQ